MSPKTFLMIPKKFIKRYDPVQIQHGTAKDREILQTTAIAWVSLKIGGFSWVVRFNITNDLSRDIIMGVEFIAGTGLSAHLGDSFVSFKFKPTVKIPILNFFSPYKCVTQSLEDYLMHIPPPESDGPDLSHLSEEESGRVRKVLDKYPDVLTKKLGKTDLIEYEIKLTDPEPVRSAPYPLTPPKMEICRNLVQKLLDDDVVELSTSDYASPAFPVPKPNNQHRLVVDYRRLNKRVKFESIPVPDMKTAFSFFGNARYYVVIDLNQAYHQVPLKKRSKEITAFAVPWNLYQYKRVPFGLSVGGCVLSRLMDMLFGDLKYKGLVNYLDDLVLYAETFDEIVKLLDEVLARLKKAGLTINPAKLQIAVQEFTYLGHRVSYRRVQIDPSRTQAIRDFEPPTSAKGIARFIGMVGFLSKFIPNFAEKAAPLNALRRKNAEFIWGEEQENSFQYLKRAISHPPVLCMPDFSKPFFLMTDASSKALASCLAQEVDSVRMPIAYYSKRLTEAESKFSAYELESLAAIMSMEHFRPFLEHAEFILETDNQALSWLLEHPKQQGRLARWIMRINSFRFKAVHVRGTQNVIADTLSRMFDDQPLAPPSDKVETNSVDPPFQVPEACNALSPELANFPLAFTDIQQHQHDDAELRKIMEKISSGERPEGYSLVKDMLCFTSSTARTPKIVVPAHLKPLLFKFYHESLLGGHLGSKKTVYKIKQLFTFRNLVSEVKAYVKACPLCAMSKPAQRRQFGLLASEVATAPMQKLYTDFVGPLIRTARGNKHILVTVDGFTKFSWLTPVPSATSDIVIRELQKISQYFSLPQILVTDNGSQFTSKKLHRWCFNRGVRHITTSPYYPNPNQAERVNRNLKAALIAYHSEAQTRWDESLEWLVQAFNYSRHEAHQSTPHELMFTYRPNTPLALQWKITDLLPDVSTPEEVKENWKRAKKNLELSHQRSKRYYDRNHQEHKFKKGDRVFVEAHVLSSKINKKMSKLSKRFKGPYHILRFTTPNSVLLADADSPNKILRAHISQLKK